MNMNNFKFVNPEQMLESSSKLYINSDINHALIEYGLIVKSNFLRWFVFGEEGQNIDDLILKINQSIICGAPLQEEITKTIDNKINCYLENLASRRKTALAFIVFNSTGYVDTISENCNNFKLSEKEKKSIIGREVAKEIYAGGSLYLHRKIRDYLKYEINQFAGELTFIKGELNKERVLEMLDLHSKTCIAKIKF
jgi:hypothetical protein